MGEVSLSGDVRRVPAIGRRLAEAARLGFTTALVPAGHIGDTMAPGPAAGIKVVPVSTIAEALALGHRLGTRPTAPQRAGLRPIRGGARLD
jgi:DNA repair protein RadA/Sms